MNRFINIVFVSANPSHFSEFKSLLKNEGTNLIYARDLEEATKVVARKTVGIILIDSEVTCFDQNQNECKISIIKLIQSSRNTELITLFLTPDLDNFAPFILSIKEGICDFISLPLRASVLNVKMEVYKRVYFEAQRAISLLKSNFPKIVIDELRKRGKIEPKRYKNAVIMFTDFVGFSSISAHLQPLEMLRQLEKYFTRFDDICDRYKIEKIKTIGDAYMTVAGITEDLPSPEIRTCLAANEIINFVETENAILRAKGEQGWQIRIGINSGSLVSGIVGRKKLIFDVWGDAVNIAARAEQSSAPGKVSITQRVYAVIAPYFNTSYFDKLEIKKRGGVIDFYYLEKLNATYSNDPWGIYPNRKVLEKCGLSSIDFYRMRQNILHLLKSSLPGTLLYHTIDRTMKIDRTIKEYAKLEALPNKDILLLRTAALYHDVGYIVEYKQNEQYATMIAKNNLPNYGYSEGDIEQICSLIWATSRKENPKNYLEELICDANSDYFGRKDYHVIAANLRKEMDLHSIKEMSEEEWLDLQLNYLQFEHRYYTDLAKNIRNKGKSRRIEELKEMKSKHSNNQQR